MKETLYFPWKIVPIEMAAEFQFCSTSLRREVAKGEEKESRVQK